MERPLGKRQVRKIAIILEKRTERNLITEIREKIKEDVFAGTDDNILKTSDAATVTSSCILGC